MTMSSPTSEQLTSTHTVSPTLSTAAYNPNNIILFADTPAPEPAAGLFINHDIYDIDTMTSTEVAKIVVVNNTTLSSGQGPENMVVGEGFSGPADVALGCLVVVMCVVALTGNSQ